MIDGHLYVDRLSGKWEVGDMAAYAKLVSISRGTSGKIRLGPVSGVEEAKFDRLSACTVSVRALRGLEKSVSALLEWGVDKGGAWFRLPEPAALVFASLGASPTVFSPARCRCGKAGDAIRLYTLLLSVEANGDLKLLPEEAKTVFGRSLNACDLRRFVFEPAIAELRGAGIEVSETAVSARRDRETKGSPVTCWLLSSKAFGAVVGQAMPATALRLSDKGILEVCRRTGLPPEEVPGLWELALSHAKEGADQGNREDVALLEAAGKDPDSAALGVFMDLMPERA